MWNRLATDEERRLEPLEPLIIGTCHVCGEHIFSNEQYAISPDGKMIHCQDKWDHDCLDYEWGELTADEKAEMLGYEVVV